MTVYGIERIREFLGAFKSNYVIIGGTATNINLDANDLIGRTTHDIDMIVVCEAMSAEYISQFWKMVRAAGYRPGMIRTEDGFKRTFYRFDNPTDKSFPKYIELFCRIPDSIIVPEDIHLVHLSNEEDYLSSFSAIMMDDEYYRFAVSHATEIEGVQVLDKFALIALKAKAYVSNYDRKASGGHVQQDDIDKHKKDVYRLAFILDAENDRVRLPEGMKRDMNTFIDYIGRNPINTKSLAKYMGAGELSQDELVERLKLVFGL